MVRRVASCLEAIGDYLKGNQEGESKSGMEVVHDGKVLKTPEITIHNLSYHLRAEIPGKFSALPTQAEATGAPELRANSDEMRISILER